MDTRACTTDEGGLNAAVLRLMRGKVNQRGAAGIYTRARAAKNQANPSGSGELFLEPPTG